MRHLSRLLLVALALSATSSIAGYGIDAGTGVEVHRKNVAEPFGLTGREERWQRVRGLPNPATADAETVARARDELRRLRARGGKSAIHLRFAPQTWPAGARAGAGHRLPLDLREAFERGRAYAEAYSDVVDAWEIDNEPDISFVEENPETFTAYFKAFALGLKSWEQRAREQGARKAGMAMMRETHERDARATWHGHPAHGARFRGQDVRATQDSSFPPPLVLMAPLALPPGPYFEHSLRNDLLSYADAFNYHYYGYTEDFTDVYRQFEAAVAEWSQAQENERRQNDVGRDRLIPPGGWAEAARYGNPALQERQLPIFLTEYGYGLMSGDAAQTVEGRVRQWRWFAEVLPQIRALRIEGSMAFVAMPYLERGHNEFGLLMRAAPPPTTADSARTDGGRRKVEAKPRTPIRLDARTTDGAANSGRRATGVKATPEAPVAKARVFAEGTASLVLYNFSDDTVSGRLELPESIVASESTPASPAAVARPQRSTPPALPSPGSAARKTEQALPAPAVTSRAEVSEQFTAGGISFVPEDFGAAHVEPWMKRIGAAATPITGGDTAAQWEASPAAAYLWDYAARHPYQSRSWSVRVAEPSRVVIDFLPGPELTQYKAASGYMVSGGAPESKATAAGASDQSSAAGDRITLAPGERLVIPIRIRVQAERFVPEVVEVRFVPTQMASATARWSTQLVPAAKAMKRETVARFDHPGEIAARARALLLERPLAREEPQLAPQGRWLVSHGVTVVTDGGQTTEAGKQTSGAGRPSSVAGHPSSGIWRFRVDTFPAEPLRPAMAELPLPEGFRFEPGTVLSLQHRIETSEPTNRQQPDMLEVLVRMANGNLYLVWPRQFPRAAWQPYWQHTDNFTMGFFGRAALPWRFQDNEPVALVFFFRPATLPATFEFTPAELVRWRTP